VQARALRLGQLLVLHRLLETTARTQHRTNKGTLSTIPSQKTAESWQSAGLMHILCVC
jgi:hypothetical protein